MNLDNPKDLQKKTLIAAIQMVSGPDVLDNLRTADKLIGLAVIQGAKLVVLPEYFLLIGASDAERYKISEDDLSGPVQTFLAKTARQYDIWLVAGSMPLRAQSLGKVRNSCLVYAPSGERVARYDKIHLFAFQKGNEHYDESAFIEAGTTPVVVQTPFARIGLSICYDLRFPELYRALGKDNPLDLILVPAAFTETTGKAHWEVLLRARAIENQCYVLAVGQGGVHPNGRETHGNSMIIDPWGKIIGRKEKGEGIVTAYLDPQVISDVRASLPALRHQVL